MFNKKILGGVALTAMTLAMEPAALAQQTTAALRGSVTSGGAPVADATVTVKHVPTGAISTVTSNSSGVFDLRGLRVGGPYNVSITAPNYAPQDVTGLYLSLGDAGGLNVELESADATVVVTAARKPTTRLADPGTRTTLGRDEIASVVTTRRDIRDIARRDPLVTIDNVTRGTGPAGGIYIAGSTPRLNRITIDGVKSADDFGLNTGGLSTTRGPISIEAIEQLSVQAVPFDVTEGDFTGGAVNIVLRGGANDFSGSAFINYQNEGLVGTRIRDSQSNLVVHLENYGGFLSGPILKDRAFFAVSGEYYDALDANASNGPADVGFTNKTNGLGGNGTTLNTSDLTGVLAAYNTYALSKQQGFGGFPIVTPTTDIKNSYRFDFNLTNDQHLQAIFRHAESTLYKTSGSATAISPITNWYVQGELEDNYALQLNSRWFKNFSTEARVSYRSYVRHQEPPQGQKYSLTLVCMDSISSGDLTNCNSGTGGVANPGSAANNTTLDSTGKAITKTPSGEPTFNIGPDQFRQANLLKTQNLSGELVGTYSLGKHLLKGGFQTKNIDIFNVFVQHALGTYYFDSVTDFQNGKAGQLQFGNNLSGKPSDAAASFNYGVRSIFAQDSWDLTDNLTVNYGVRYDYYQNDSKPRLNPQFLSRYGFSNQETYDGRDVLMPRLSFKYTPTDEFELSGGVGLFSGGLPDVFLSNSFGNTGVLSYQVTVQRLADGTFRDGTTLAAIDSTIGNQLLNVNTATYGLGVPSVALSLLNPNSAAAQTTEVDALAKNFEMPSDWKANLSAHLNTRSGWRFGFDYVGTRSKDNLAFRDQRARLLTIGGKQAYTPDGRIRYDGIAVSGANSAAILAARQTAGLPVATDPLLANLGGTPDVVAYNPSKDNESNTVAFSVGKAFEKLNLDVQLAYILGESNNFGALTEFATTASGFLSDQFSSYDPNGSVSGRATNEISDQFKVTVGWEHNFVGSLKSRFTLFGEARSGRPFSLLMNDATSGRGPVFGVTRNDQLLYVPDVNSPDPSNPLKFVSPSANAATGAPTIVFFDSASTLANFTATVNRFNLQKNRIMEKNELTNPQVNQIDFQFAQELPTYYKDHKLLFTVDVKNLLNLLNEDWGVVREFTSSRGGSGRVISVSCADPTTGAAVATGSAACGAYRYSNYNSASTGPAGDGTIDTSSRWYVQLGLKYSF